jgi:hypothetical protein
VRGLLPDGRLKRGLKNSLWSGKGIVRKITVFIQVAEKSSKNIFIIIFGRIAICSEVLSFFVFFTTAKKNN